MTPRVVFVCLHGSAKSLIAAEHFCRLAAQQGLDVRATSAGTDPDPEIPLHVIEGLLADGIDVRGRRPPAPPPGGIGTRATRRLVRLQSR